VAGKGTSGPGATFTIEVSWSRSVTVARSRRAYNHPPSTGPTEETPEPTTEEPTTGPMPGLPETSARSGHLLSGDLESD